MADYKIVEVTPLMDIDKRGRFVKVYRVKFEYKGMEDFIDIPEDKYKPEEVKKRIEEVISTHKELLI